MKKLVLTLLAATLVSGALAQNATTFPDIPANHWAAAAVSRIAKLGIVIGFPDGTFRGNEAFTRYQAALVISRLLDVVNQNVNSALAVTKSDIQSLRNAVQGVASDVASQGVRLSSAESAIASLSDDVTANKSSIASNTNQIAANASRLDKIEQEISALQAAAAQPTTAAPAAPAAPSVSPAVLRDLQNQIASQRVAIDTAQAQADAAAKRANDAHDLANQAMSQAQQNAAALAAANTALQNLTDEVNKLQSQAAAPAPAPAAPAAPVTPAAPAPAAPPSLGGLPGDVQRNTSDIANIRQFVILLRRDQVALRDRVSALETGAAQQSKDIASLTKRVTALENNPLGISGSIEVEYYAGWIIGPAFDVDRAYGVGNTRSMGSSVFSSGAVELTGDSPGDSTYQTDVNEVAQDRADITASPGAVTSTLTINVATNLNGTSSPNALNNFNAVLSLSLLQADNLNIMNPDGSTPTNTSGTPELPNGGSITQGYVIHVDAFTTTFGPIGAAPLTFSFGTGVETTFTPYLVNTDDPGFLATMTSPDFLKFINPSVALLYTAPATAQDGSTALTNVYTYGAHVTLNPLKGITVGGSYVQGTSSATNDKNNVNADNTTDTVYGVNANASVSMFNLAFEWDSASQVNQVGAAAAPQTLLYAKLNINGANLPIINSLDVNYRDIPALWENGNQVNYAMIYDAGSNSSNYPFAIEDGNGDMVGQKGYGASADLSLFILDVSGYYDNYTFNTGADTVQAYGADATAKLFAGFSLSGFFHSVTLDGVVVNNLEDNYGVNGVAVIGNEVNLDHNYDTGFGVSLTLDGTASNALIPNLDLSASYSQTGNNYGIRTIDVKGDYKLSVAFLTLTPYGEYQTVSYPTTWTANNDGTTTIQGGAGLTTTPLSVPLAPSLLGAVNYRTTNHTNVTGGTGPYTANEFQWSVGVVLNKFLFPHSTLTAKYGSWSGQNITFQTGTNGTTCYDSLGNTSTCTDTASDISNGDVAPVTAGVNTEQSVNGYEVSWNYYDLVLSYGNYVNNRTNPAGVPSSNSAEAFQITYTVNF